MIVENLQNILLNIEQERDLDVIVQRIVQGLAAQPGVALARLWLNRSGADGTLGSTAGDPCLELVGSQGVSILEPEADWSQTGEASNPVPLNLWENQTISSRGEPVLVKSLSVASEWVSHPEWLLAEKVISLAGNPLLVRGEGIGIINIFSRIPLDDTDAEWLGLFADHAAVAIRNARAFQQVQLDRDDLARENQQLREQILEARGFTEMVGRSQALQKIQDQIRLVAPTHAGVLILGESGTGKDLVAQAIHRHSQRQNQPLVKVNCGAIPKDLFESEFFGHVKGAFTGAVGDREGRFQLADGGTLFLDEVGEIPLNLQSKLLRVLQEGCFERIGDARTRSVDVRIIAATNRNLEGSQDFRQDLFYRLSVFPIEVLPLRQRKEDIPLLARHFIDDCSRRLNCQSVQLTANDIMRLQQYDWPGNIRELQNIIERAVISARNGRFELVLGQTPQPWVPAVASEADDGEYLTQADMDALERRNLEKVMALCGWKVSGKGGAAERLGVKPTTLYSRLRAMGVSRPA